MRAAVLANLATDDSAILLAQTVINPEYMLSSPITSPVMYPKALRQKKAARPIPSPLPHPDQHAQLVSGKPGRALCDPSLYSHAANAPRAKAGASPAVSHLQRISSMARAVSPTGWGVLQTGRELDIHHVDFALRARLLVSLLAHCRLEPQQSAW
mmetsp:Transcript_48537/g.109351  ORF Transcript_48537/g.109351 Transcript_48537/m.109351 type:complete len:155 (-) Transcript_48537:344-808(-)